MGDRIVLCVQCAAITKRGTRCKRMTKKGNMCTQHLGLDEGLRIKKSTIPGAGWGLFATKDFAKDKKIVDYTGTVSREPIAGAYVLELNPHTFIDGNRSTDVGGYSNMCRKKDCAVCCGNNSKLTRYKSEARLKATKKIAAGKEIFTSYGREYFK